MANWLPSFHNSGLRVVPVYDGTVGHAWRIDVRFNGKQFGIDVEPPQFADDAALSVSLYKLNTRLAQEGRVGEVTVEHVRRLEMAHG